MKLSGNLNDCRIIEEHVRTGKTYLVAEIGQAHDGSVGILHSFIDAVADVGVDAVKFQVHIAEAESSAEEPFRTDFSYVDATRYDYWERMELTEPQWVEVFEHCSRAGVEFIATPFSTAAVNLLERIGSRCYKIGSGDITNKLLLERVARTGKETIISTGLGELDEIDEAVALFRKHKVPVVVLQCTTKYPTEAEDVDLLMIPKMIDRYACPVGLSDHSGQIYAGLAAAALGASVVEVHVTFDRRMYGPDSQSSLMVDELAQLVHGVQYINAALRGSCEKVISEEKMGLREIFGKSLAVSRDLPAGHILAFEDLEGKKPANMGISASRYDDVLGKRIRAPKKRWEFLIDNDLEY